MPRIGTVEPAGDLRIKLTWSRGEREGKTDQVDLSPIVKAMKSAFRRSVGARRERRPGAGHRARTALRSGWAERGAPESKSG